MNDNSKAAPVEGMKMSFKITDLDMYKESNRGFRLGAVERDDSISSSGSGVCVCWEGWGL